jgi:hypothetical protein
MKIVCQVLSLDMASLEKEQNSKAGFKKTRLFIKKSI